MKIHHMIQKTPEWMAIRAGIPTASEFHNLVSPTWEIRTGKMPATYLARKLAERWLGAPLASFNAYGAVEQGNVLEEEAIPFYELDTGDTVERVGFVTDDSGKIGCSPDGLLNVSGIETDISGIEIKCPESHTHVGYLLKGVLPEDYLTQVHGSMLVTGAPQWKFLSYCRQFPPLLLTVPRDPIIMDVLHTAVTDFNAKLDRAYARLVDLNGGEPVRHVVDVQSAGGVTTMTLEGEESDLLEAFMNSPAMHNN